MNQAALFKQITICTIFENDFFLWLIFIRFLSISNIKIHFCGNMIISDTINAMHCMDSYPKSHIWQEIICNNKKIIGKWTVKIGLSIFFSLRNVRVMTTTWIVFYWMVLLILGKHWSECFLEVFVVRNLDTVLNFGDYFCNIFIACCVRIDGRQSINGWCINCLFIRFQLWVMIFAFFVNLLSHFHHFVWKVGQFGNMNTETFINNTRFDLIQQCKHIIIRFSVQVQIFHGGHRIRQVWDLMEMGGEQSKTANVLGQCPWMEKKDWFNSLSFWECSKTMIFTQL